MRASRTSLVRYTNFLELTLGVSKIAVITVIIMEQLPNKFYIDLIVLQINTGYFYLFI